MVRGTQKYECVDHYIADLCERLWKAFKEAQVKCMSEAVRQKWHYDTKANAISLEPGDLVLAKANAYGGGERWRISGRRICMKWSPKLQRASLLTSWKTSILDAHEFSTEINFFPLLQQGDSSLYSCAGQEGQVHHHHPRGTNWDEWDWGSTSKWGLSITSPVSDRWDSSRVGE